MREPTAFPNRKPILAIAGVVIAIVIVFALMHSRGNNAPPSNPIPERRRKSKTNLQLARITGSRTQNGRFPSPEIDCCQRRSNAPGDPRHPQERAQYDPRNDQGERACGRESVGKVIAAKFRTSGPSQYFAQKAMKAAEQWSLRLSPTQRRG